MVRNHHNFGTLNYRIRRTNHTSCGGGDGGDDGDDGGDGATFFKFFLIFIRNKNFFFASLKS
jgi:hypothetical protein